MDEHQIIVLGLSGRGIEDACGAREIVLPVVDGDQFVFGLLNFEARNKQSVQFFLVVKDADDGDAF